MSLEKKQKLNLALKENLLRDLNQGLAKKITEAEADCFSLGSRPNTITKKSTCGAEPRHVGQTKKNEGELRIPIPAGQVACNKKAVVSSERGSAVAAGGGAKHRSYVIAVWRA